MTESSSRRISGDDADRMAPMVSVDGAVGRVREGTGDCAESSRLDRCMLLFMVNPVEDCRG